MKNIICFLFLALSTTLFAQKPAVVSIQTNAQCGDCKERIETTLNQTKGVVCRTQFGDKNSRSQV